MATIDLRAQVLDVLVARGDAWSLEVTIESPAGTPVNLTGKTIEAHLRNQPDSASKTDLDVAPVDLSAGTFTVGQDAATAGGVYDVQVTTAGLARTYLRGTLELDDDVTHA